MCIVTKDFFFMLRHGIFYNIINESNYHLLCESETFTAEPTENQHSSVQVSAAFTWQEPSVLTDNPINCDHPYPIH